MFSLLEGFDELKIAIMWQGSYREGFRRLDLGTDSKKQGTFVKFVKNVYEKTLI